MKTFVAGFVFIASMYCVDSFGELLNHDPFTRGGEVNKKKVVAPVHVFYKHEKNKVAEFRRIVERKNPQYKDLIREIFEHEKFQKDTVLAEMRKKGKTKFKGLQGYLDYINAQSLIDSANIIYEENKWDLFLLYKNYGIEPRAFLAKTAVETRMGGFLGNHTWGSIFANLYATTSKKDFAVQQFSGMLKVADSLGLSADSLHNLPCSFMGAAGIGQFIPTTMLYDYRGKYGTLKGSDLFDFGHTVHAITNFYVNRGYKKGREDLMSRFYNPGFSLYWRAIKHIRESIPYKSLEDVKMDIKMDFMRKLEKIEPRKIEERVSLNKNFYHLVQQR